MESNTKNKFSKDIFLEVFNTNLQRLSQSMKNKAEDMAIMIGDPLVTDNENRQMARDYFVKELCKHLHEKL